MYTHAPNPDGMEKWKEKDWGVITPTGRVPSRSHFQPSHAQMCMPAPASNKKMFKLISGELPNILSRKKIYIQDYVDRMILLFKFCRIKWTDKWEYIHKNL